ncbi:MAG: hypothetical protein CAF45_013830 [Nitrospira sp. CG24E]|nr:MAG: hypothetical protein CAF45_013830 [Nitrospira sp. CG24E]
MRIVSMGSKTNVFSLAAVDWMILEHDKLPPFEPLLKRTMELALSSGLKALSSSGLKTEDIKFDEQARSRFVRGCHYGYDKAQQRISATIIELHAQSRLATQSLKLARRNKDKNETSALIQYLKVIQNQELVLRRLLDSLLYVLVQGKVWILKRMLVDTHIRPVDPHVLARTTKTASERNATSRYRFSLVTDLTTIAQIGDLVEVDLSSSAEERWRIIELKEGKVNEILSGLLEEVRGELSSQELEKINSSLGEKAVKQVRRMVNQQNRLGEFWKIIKTDRGIDPLIKTEIRMTPTEVVTEDYLHLFQAMLDETHKHGVAAQSVNTCLHLFATTASLFDREGSRALISHIFYHAIKPDRPCKLGQSDENEEWREIQGCPPIIDLVEFNIHSQWGCPIFTWPIHRDRMLDLLTNRMRLFGCFDIEGFFRMVEKQGPKTSWIVGEAAAKLGKLSGPIPGGQGARGVRIEHPNGHVDQYLSGFFSRVFRELATPNCLLGAILRGPTEWAQAIKGRQGLV